MTAVENKQLLQNIFAELAQGNSRLLVESMVDDFRWRVTGNTKWSRSYNGKETVLKELLAPLRSMIADRIRTIAHHFIAEAITLWWKPVATTSLKLDCLTTTHTALWSVFVTANCAK